MARAGKYLTTYLGVLLLMVISVFYFTNVARAETLGPIVYNSNNLNESVSVWIVSPSNITYYKDYLYGLGPYGIIMNFYLSTTAFTNDAGYSVDGGPIERVSNLTVISETLSNRTTTYFKNIIFTVPIGEHTVAVFDGYQSNGHYEVYQKDSITFSVAFSPLTTPSPTVPEFPITISLVIVLAAVSLLLVIGKRKLNCHYKI